MKKISFIILTAMLCCGYGCTTNAQKKPVLIWAEEFDYTGLPDANKWKYEKGMVRNHELQYYTDARLENTEVRDGSLVITARKEVYEQAEYTSASIHTKGIFSFQGGRVEVRAKLPEGRGTWPAIWTLGENGKRWPDCGEIDIMEFVGYTPGEVYANVHTRDYNHTKNTGRGGSIAVEQPFKDYHIYAVEWFDDRMDFFFDDTLYYTCPRKGEGEGEWPFETPQYLKINLAIGGDWGGQKGVDENIFPVEYRIDYVRIYSLK